MKKINIHGDFCYQNVKGENYYDPNLVFKKCVISYPVIKKIKVNKYLIKSLKIYIKTLK